MQAWEGTFQLQVGQTAELSPVLSVGSLATQVSVVADAAPLVTTTDATLATALERTRIEQLPMNGRSIPNLVMADTPGLHGGVHGANEPIVYGLRDSVALLQDGAVIVNRDVGNFGGRLPGVDSVEELRVETSLSSAKFNRPGSIILSTRSGTNQVHGSLFETARNSGVGVARARQDFYTKPPQLIRNEFGGSVGGPVYLPKVYNGKDRTFFFTTYELLRNVNSTTLSTTMPTMAMRGGDFSGLIDSVGRRITLYDPSTTDSKTWQRQPFTNNQIPMNRQSPLAKYLYSVMPKPTNSANPMVDSNYFGLAPRRTKDYTSTTRVDHRLSDRDQIFGRFTFGDNNYYFNQFGVPSLDLTMNYSYNLNREINGSGSWTHSFSPTFLSETLVTFAHNNMFVGPPAGTPNIANALGMPNPINNPWLAWQSTNMGFGLNYMVQQMRQNFTNILSADQNFTRILGRHQIEFGMRLRHEYLDVLADQPFAQSNFSTLATALFDPSSGSAYAATPQTGHAAASLFLGTATNYVATVNRSFYHMRDREYAAYIQDNWKVTPRLTLNIGLRYENLPAFTEKDNYRLSFDSKSKSMVLGQPLEELYRNKQTTPEVVAKFQALGVKFTSPADAGLPDSLVHGNPWNFLPRFGFAYRMGETATPFVVRGGYGLYHSQISLRTWNSAERAVPPLGYTVGYSVNDQATAPDRLPNYELRSVPLYIAGVNSRDVLNKPDLVALSPGFGVAYADPHQPPPRAQEWNLSVERQIFPGTVAKIAYVGTHASNLQQDYQYNNAPSSYVWYARTGLAQPTGTYAATATRPFDQTTYGTIRQFMNTGYSNANAFQVELRRRSSRGYGYAFYYVMTNAFTVTDRSADGGNGSFSSPWAYLPGAVPEDFDKLNRFLNYRRDTTLPKHQVRYNWVVDLPFGKGKMLGRNAGGFLDRLIGGWQVAGLGSYRSNYWSLPTDNWGAIGNVEVYGRKYPIQDCRSGTCIPGYLWWNGYIPANRINSHDAKGKPNGVMGVPQEYRPAITPLTPIPANGGSSADPNYVFYDTNNINFVLKNGSTVRTSVDNGLHPWRYQFMRGPGTFGLDASLFKSIVIKENLAIRFNADFFNVLNHPGLAQPAGNGILSLQNSANSPRVLQFTLRLVW
jgi:hypothetical protein